MSPRSNRKTSNRSAVNFNKKVTSMSCKLEPAIWPRYTGQRISCFDRCQLIVALMSNIKEVHSKPRLYVSVNLFWSMAAMLRDSVAAVVVVRTRPRALPLTMITMRKSIHGFPFLSQDKYGAPLLICFLPDVVPAVAVVIAKTPYSFEETNSFYCPLICARRNRYWSTHHTAESALTYWAITFTWMLFWSCYVQLCSCSHQIVLAKSQRQDKYLSAITTYLSFPNREIIFLKLDPNILIEDTTWLRGDTKFLFECTCWKIYRFRQA